MTAEEVLKKQDCTGYVQGEVFGDFHYEKHEIIDAMKEYAQLKCKQLLEIVVEKVTLNEEYYNNVKTVIEKGSNSYDGEQVKISIDKDSILNCVDIEIFCK